MKLKTKPLTNNKITKIIQDYEERFEAIFETLQSLQMNQPDFQGALILNLTDASDKVMPYYMVRRFHVDEPYVKFSHLVPAEGDSFGIETFPKKPAKVSTRAFISGLERNKRYNKLEEQFFIPNVLRTQFIGKFSYTKFMDIEDTHATLQLPESAVLSFTDKKNDRG